jgi:deferrochelatase/peroxidase EfeB
MNHALVTVALPFSSDRAGAVSDVLRSLGNPAEGAARDALNDTAIVHFMSLTVVRDTAPGLAHLALELSADGGPEQALEAVCNVLRDVLEGAFKAAGIDRGDETMAAYLLRRNLRLGSGWLRTTGFGFAGVPNMSVRRIRAEADIAERIAGMDVLEKKWPASKKLWQVRETLWGQNEKWAFSSEPAPFLGNAKRPFKIPQRVALALVALARLSWPLLPIPLLLWSFVGFWLAAGLSVVGIVAGLGAAAWYLRRLETRDRADDTTPNAAKVEACLLDASTAQNLLLAVSEMKPGFFRRLTLRLAFGIAEMDVAHLFRPGFLRNMGVIHFARWGLIPGTDKLLFWSNFSGGWESYLEEFIEKAGSGLTAIWSNARGFPDTKFLLGEGAADGDRFRRWARRQQQPVDFWYSGYPEFTMGHIRRNAAIRQGIAAARTEADAEEWLSCFGSEPRPDFMLDKTQIPTLILGALKRLHHSTCIIVRLPDNPEQARKWLAKIADEISFGEVPRGQPAAAIAFTMQGLVRLGMDKADLATFPAAFQNGMTASARSRALGDIGPNAPECWLWGSAHSTDSAILLYDHCVARLANRTKAITDSIKEFGGKVEYIKRLKELPQGQVHEPFGFADGISQPILRDTPRARSPHNAEHVVDAGEFVLGYRDNRGHFPPTPMVAAGHDPDGCLAQISVPKTGTTPSFDGGGSDRWRDFGRNGTFLVIRHLEQNPGAFHDFSAAEARRLSADRDGPFAKVPQDYLQRLLEAKMMGRWAEGGSLVRHALPAKRTDNDFTYEREDPQGLACPFGAHIRRANPRDSLDIDASGQLRLSNRHRILRIGRRYEEDPKSGLPGLMFMCLNADIERQFEFVQQNWILGRSFHDLPNEQDPIAGELPGRGIFTIPTPQGPVRLGGKPNVRGLPDFVTVQGGGYFFMPGRRALQFLARDGK